MPELWYDKAAEYWEQALPVGNGRIGAMIWSGTASERISLNEESLWSGYPEYHSIPNASDFYKKARDLALAGDYLKSQELIEQGMLSRFTQCYLPLGELRLHFSETGDVTDYRRSLDLETALSKMTYKQNDITFTRECFVSAEDNAFVMKISSDSANAITFTAQLTCQLRAAATADGQRLRLEGIAPSEGRPSYVPSDNPIIYEEEPSKRGMRFIAIADFEADGGEVYSEGGVIYVYKADSVIIRICARTSYNGPFKHPYLDGAPYEQNCNEDLEHVLKINYDKLRERHINDYQELYKRVDISFGDGRDNIPLPERLYDWERAEDDTSLLTLLFQYGRYLLISSSRPGTLPSNLQGIWNQHLRAPWSSNFTININTEMNYWPAEPVNLSECHEPLLDFLETLRTTGAKTARDYYDAGGFTAHHNTDIWGLSNAVGEGGRGFAVYAFWSMSGGWLASHVYQHYAYTMDKVFLKEKGWQIIRDAARFYLDVMTEDTDGTLIFAPSTSPENSFIYKGSNCPVAKTATMTTAIIKETLQNAVSCCDILDIEPEFRAQAAEALKKMPDYKIGSRGEFLEWSEELPEAEPEHRHNSHLYPLYPGLEITKDSTPELAQACKRTLELRGEESTGWALAWRINLWARLGEGDRAFALLKKQLRPLNFNKSVFSENGGCYHNLFGAHPPFQIDSNFGACAGIAEMLLQSRDDEIKLLPALPKALSTGFVKGLRARGGITVDISFENGTVTEAVLKLDTQLEEKHIKLKYNNKVKDIILMPDKQVTII